MAEGTHISEAAELRAQLEDACDAGRTAAGEIRQLRKVLAETREALKQRVDCPSCGGSGVHYVHVAPDDMDREPCDCDIAARVLLKEAV